MMLSEVAEMILCDIRGKRVLPLYISLSVFPPLISSSTPPPYGQMLLQAQLDSVRRFL